MNEKELYILWTSDNEITAEKMVFMYGINALKHKWFDKVTLIIWGASSKLAANNNIIKMCIADALNEGVKVSACKACADQLGATESLEKQGVEVKYWGQPLTNLLLENKKILSI